MNNVPTKTFSSPKEALAYDKQMNPNEGVSVKLGKGRMSLEAKARLAIILKAGYKINGYTLDKSTSNVKVDKGNSAVTPERGNLVIKTKVANSNDIIEPAPYRYDIDEMKAVADDGETFDMKQACNNCGYSLCGHTCNTPMVFGKPVKIVKR